MLVLLSVLSLPSLSVEEGRESGEKIEAYHDELMMHLMSMLLVPSLLSLSVGGRKKREGEGMEPTMMNW